MKVIIMKTLFDDFVEMELLDDSINRQYQCFNDFTRQIDNMINFVIDKSVEKFLENEKNENYNNYYRYYKDNSLPIPENTSELKDLDQFSIKRLVSTDETNFIITVMIQDRNGDLVWETETYIPILYK